MNVTYNKTSDLTGTITVNLQPEDYNPAYQKKIKELIKTINIPGFRVGHAPKSMVEKMYGQSVLLDEINKAAGSALYNYIENEKIKILGEPILNKETQVSELSTTNNYSFSFDIGMSPSFELNVTANDTFTKYSVIITDEMINEEVERICSKYGSLNEAEQVGENDVVYFNMVELNEGTVLEGGVNASAVPVLMSKVKNEDIRKTLLGSAKNSEHILNIFALFDNDEGEISHALGVQKAGVADLGPDFKSTITDIKSNKPAELNTELFDKVYGQGNVANEEEFRNKIKEELAAYFNEQAKHLVEHELFDKLVDKHNIQLPDEFLKAWLIQTHPDKFNDTNIDEKYQSEANYLKNHLFEEKILEANNIKISYDDIRETAYSYTRGMFGSYGSYGLTDEMMQSIVEPQLKKEDFRSRMINIAIRKRVNDYILNTVTLQEKQVSEKEFIAVMQEHNHKHHAQHTHSELHQESTVEA
ncbi:MAG: trigger factor [Bacteroidia bacterium]